VKAVQEAIFLKSCIALLCAREQVNWVIVLELVILVTS
jgi:hypothetical protein